MKKFLLLFTFTLLVAACKVESSVSVNVNDDGTGSVEVSVELDDEASRLIGDIEKQLRTEDLVSSGWKVSLPEDLKEKSKIAVIGRLVARDIFKQEDPLGKFINIGSRAFKVVGVFQDSGGDVEESKIFMPYTTRQQILMGSDKIGNIALTFNPEICLLYTSPSPRDS